MIDQDLIDSLDAENQHAAREALIALAGCGLIASQIERIHTQLISGSETEHESVLATRILAARHKLSHLRALQQLGVSLAAEE